MVLNAFSLSIWSDHSLASIIYTEIITRHSFSIAENYLIKSEIICKFYWLLAHYFYVVKNDLLSAQSYLNQVQSCGEWTILIHETQCKIINSDTVDSLNLELNTAILIQTAKTLFENNRGGEARKLFESHHSLLLTNAKNTSECFTLLKTLDLPLDYIHSIEYLNNDELACYVGSLQVISRKDKNMSFISKKWRTCQSSSYTHYLLTQLISLSVLGHEHFQNYYVSFYNYLWELKTKFEFKIPVCLNVLVEFLLKKNLLSADLYAYNFLLKLISNDPRLPKSVCFTQILFIEFHFINLV